jgi:hypothetical protein
VLLTLMSPSGVLYMFKHTGHMAGTVEPGSRDDDWSESGNNPLIAANWADLQGATEYLQTDVDFDAAVLLEDIKHAWDDDLSRFVGEGLLGQGGFSLIDALASVTLVPPSFSNETIHFRAGVEGSSTFRAEGSPDPDFSIHDSLPAGLSFNKRTNVLSGTTWDRGTYTLHVRAANAAGTAEAIVTLIVD